MRVDDITLYSVIHIRYLLPEVFFQGTIKDVLRNSDKSEECENVSNI
jgi:hypothetical protein